MHPDQRISIPTCNTRYSARPCAQPPTYAVTVRDARSAARRLVDSGVQDGVVSHTDHAWLGSGRAVSGNAEAAAESSSVACVLWPHFARAPSMVVFLVVAPWLWPRPEEVDADSCLGPCGRCSIEQLVGQVNRHLCRARPSWDREQTSLRRGRSCPLTARGSAIGGWAGGRA